MPVVKRHVWITFLAVAAIFALLSFHGIAFADSDTDPAPVPTTDGYPFFQVDEYCPHASSSTRYIATSIICDFVGILNTVISEVYNGIGNAMVQTVRAVLTLYLAVFGAQLLMGTAQLQARDILARFIKIAIVWAFATNAKYGIGLAFYFFMGFMADAGQSIVNALLAGQSNPICNAAFPSLNEGSDPSNIMPLFSFFDQMIFCAFSGPGGSIDIKIAGFFLTMCTLYPPMFGIFTWWLQSTIFALARTIMAFLTSLAAIAFLIALSPIFLCLMLFQITSQFFDNWLRYLIAYAVQMVLVLGIVVMWMLMMLQFVNFFSELSNIIQPFSAAQQVGAHLTPTNSWSICDATYWSDGPPFFKQHGRCRHDGPYTNQDLIPPTKIINQLGFVDYVFYNLIALLVISYSFTMLLERVHEISGSLAGNAPLPAFKGGFGSGMFGQNSRASRTNPLKPAPRGG